MKVTVKEGCISCGLCAGTCPEVFNLDSGVAPGSEFGVDLLTQGQEARDSCPVNAISIEE